jgi:large subunit ribosomal protein L4e
MFAAIKTYRRWHRRVNKNQRRYAVASALAATALPSLVLARGHKIDKVAELPLVVSSKIENLQKTKEAVALLKALNAYADVEKVKDTKKVRPGIGKMRNRRYIHRKGPLLIMNEKGSGWKAFRNLPGVDLGYGSALNLLQLAPGGHLGRFVIFSENAFKDLVNWFGDATHAATSRKYRLPRSIVSNTDVTRVINSSELQSILRRKRRSAKPKPIRRNALRNKGEYTKLSPYSKVLRSRIRKQVKKSVAKGTGAKVAAAKPATKPAAKPAAKAAAKAASPAKK